MKKYIVSVFLFLTIIPALYAQNRSLSANTAREGTPGNQSRTPSQNPKDSTKVETPSIYVWQISPRLGEQTIVPRDSVLENFHQTSLVDGKGVAIGYLGNIGSPAVSKVFFERDRSSRFIFQDAFRFWHKAPEDQLFLNTKIPYSNIYYQSGGGGENSENRLVFDLSSNFGKKFNVGLNIDYLYARGFYQSLYNKQINYDVYASYIGDKYKMHVFIANNNFNNSENGGITNPLYITNPNSEKLTIYPQNSLDIPVNITNTWNKLQGRHIYVTNRYDLGNDTEEYNVNDSTKAFRKKEDYTSLASVIFTTHYADQRRRIVSLDPQLDSIYYYKVKGASTPRYEDDIDDRMYYYSFKNTFALAMNEGFRSWTKFGLTAFVESDIRRFAMPIRLEKPKFEDHYNGADFRPTGIPGISVGGFKEDVLFIGGVLSKEKGKYLRYKVYLEKDVLNVNGDFGLEGQIITMWHFKGKSMAVKANAYVKSLMPSFFENHFTSKYWTWDNNFDNTHKVFVGGEINLPEFSFSQTRISGGFEDVQNLIYYDSITRFPVQESGNVQVVSFRLDQKFNFRALHWDSQVVYQATTNDKVIPVPTLAFYTNVYLLTKIAKVLTLQLGADAHYHTKYFAQGYEPLTIQFYNQRDQKIGNFPIATAYANLHLKNTRFFIMMYNLGQGIGNSAYFSLPNYPVNPRIIKLGFSWQFNN